MTSMWVIRGILIGLSAVLSIVLILHGNVIIGVILAALAVTRAAMFVRIRRRHRRLRRRLSLRR